MEHKDKIKPVITVSCLPGDLTEEGFVEIHQTLVEAMEEDINIRHTRRGINDLVFLSLT